MMQSAAHAEGQRVFDTLATAWLREIQRLAPYLATGYSWEEWGNVEGWLALHAAGYTVTPRGRYRSLASGYGDLLVESPVIDVMVEVKTIHDDTFAKYAGQVDEDPVKLRAEAEAGRATLFVVILTARNGESPWRHLHRLECWGVPTELRRTARLGDTGSVEVRGWLLLPPS